MLKKLGLLGLVMIVSLAIFPVSARPDEPIQRRWLYYSNSSKTVQVGERGACDYWGVTSSYVTVLYCYY